MVLSVEELRERKRKRAQAERDARTTQERDEYNRRRRLKAALDKVEGKEPTSVMTYSPNFTPEQRERYNANRRRQRERQRQPRTDRGVHPTFALKRDLELEAEQAERERAEERARYKQTRFYRPVWADGDHHV